MTTKDTNRFYWTSSQVAEFFGIAEKTLWAWKKMDSFPRHSILGRGLWNAKLIYAWHIEYIFGDKGVMKRRMIADMMEKVEKAKIRKLEREQLEGSLISREEISETRIKRIYEVKSGLLTLPRVLPQDLVGKDFRDWGGIIKKHIMYLLNQFSRRENIRSYKKISDGQQEKKTEQKK